MWAIIPTNLNASLISTFACSCTGCIWHSMNASCHKKQATKAYYTASNEIYHGCAHKNKGGLPSSTIINIRCCF
ncbi:protein of unknown function [Legionella micdadei]|uniref:Uncharacterized protein n=1 Tax=Legionella micdadei TaxID=451 RepID=A0A098GGL1_LEGMI|nr:protein of unknown function [Legionella micdadei]